jgi:hypothetical protein
MAMSRAFTREEFYDLVWSKPMTHLAREFALSDVALHKICRKHNIPNPPLGWWAKKAAGKKVRQTPLPKPGAGVTDRIVIAGGELRREGGEIASVREQARIKASSSPAAEQRSHPILERTTARLRKTKPGPTGIVAVDASGLIKCAVAPASVDRLATALGPIIDAVAQQGFRLAADGGAARFVGEEETVAFSITEAVRRVKHELTEKERAVQEKWERKAERARLRNEWDIYFSRPTFPEWDYVPTGQLSFELEHIYVWSGASPRRTFRDAKVQRLENMASDIAVGVAVLAAAKTADRIRREEEKRRAEEQRRLRELGLRAKHVEERRTSALDTILVELEQANRVRRLLDGLRRGLSEAPASRIAEFIRWSEHHLAEREAALGAEGLGRRFEEQRLFGYDDGEGFRPPHWY